MSSSPDDQSPDVPALIPALPQGYKKPSETRYLYNPHTLVLIICTAHRATRHDEEGHVLAIDEYPDQADYIALQQADRFRLVNLGTLPLPPIAPLPTEQ